MSVYGSGSEDTNILIHVTNNKNANVELSEELGDIFLELMRRNSCKTREHIAQSD